MTPQKIEELKTLLTNAGYEKELNDILFIEDIDLKVLEPIDIELIDFDVEPIEFDELY